MSQKERARKVTLSSVVEGKLTLVDAAKKLNVSYRQIKRIHKRYVCGGDRGLVHGNCGKASHRAHSMEFKQTVLTRYRDTYLGFGPTLASEKLGQEGYSLSDETLRLWLIHEGLWERQRKRKGYRERRPRRECFGELLQLDGSHHAWFGGDHTNGCLMNLVDDATGTTLSLLADQETTEAAMLLLKKWIERYGIPQALYVDLKTVYVSPKRGSSNKDSGEFNEGFTHFSKACWKLGIRIIKAYSPQAKGRVERNHAVYQDRFVKELALQGIKTIEGGNALLHNGFIDELNRKFSKVALSEIDAHTERCSDEDLWQTFCWESTRVVQHDWTIRFEGLCYQIEETKPIRARPKQSVWVRKHLDGAVSLWRKDQRLPAHLIARPVPGKRVAEPRGYDAFLASKNSRKSKMKSPWNTFNPGWLSGPNRQEKCVTEV